MKMIWISFLLIGHVICGPVRKDYRSDNVDPRFMQPPFSGFWYSGVGVNPGSGSSSPLPSQLNPSTAKKVPAQDDGSFSGRQDFYSTTTNMDETNRGNEEDSGPEESQYWGSVAAYAPGNDYGGEAAGSEPVVSQDPNAEAVARYYTEASAAKAPEPVFSDVSDLEPVYSFSSRSRYNRGRAVFSQTRYTPGEPPFFPLMPMSRVRRPSVQSRPADAPAKGGF
ncbi:uncharacterized protein [Paralichthys olivaceus]|uniref:uncharacterized protein n=1 Tax=Paralichthys olivaceus TaxID=8255 RepID=UPI00375295B9